MICSSDTCMECAASAGRRADTLRTHVCLLGFTIKQSSRGGPGTEYGFVCMRGDTEGGQTNQTLSVRSRGRSAGGSRSEPWHCLMVFREQFLWAEFGVRAEGSVAFFWLVVDELLGQCFRNLLLCLELSSSSWARAVVLQKNSNTLISIFLEEKPGSCPIDALLFLSSSFFFFFCFSSHTWLVTVGICPLVLRAGRSRRLQPFPCKQETRHM